jgi:hypothetical protein
MKKDNEKMQIKSVDKKNVIADKVKKEKISEVSKKTILTDSPIKTLSENSILESDESEKLDIDPQEQVIEIDDVTIFENKEFVENLKDDSSIYNELPIGNLMGNFKISEIEDDSNENREKIIEEIKPVRRIRHDGGIHF